MPASAKNNEPAGRNAQKAIDTLQQRLTSYACGLNYDGLPPGAIHAAKVRIIDTLGALIGGFFGEPCRIARNLAAQMPNPSGATVIGTRMKTTADIAAFVNATTSRYAELMDAYHQPGSGHGHISDTITPIISAAEYARANGRELITAVVLSYEVCLRISDVFHSQEFDITNFVTVGSAVGAGKVLRLTSSQFSHCISMAVVPNNILSQVRMGQQGMFKGAASGQAGRAGVFAALLAQAGMEGPHLPFEGKAGWCDHIAGSRFSLDTMGGNGTSFKVLETTIKMRPCNAGSISSIIAAEKVAPRLNVNEVKHVTVETHRHAKEKGASADEYHWDPETREGADHSIPYLVAAALMDGTVTLRSFNDAHLWNPQLRALMQKIEVVENKQFTKAFEQLPVEHLSRVTVVTQSGEQLVGESGGDEDDLSAPKSDAQIEDKFRGLSEDVLGAKRVSAVLDRLWHLEDVTNVAEIPSVFVFD